jgi:hypothetical protein
VETPGAVPEAAASVKVLVPLPGDAMLVREKLAVTPLGSPLTDNATAELNPVPAVVVNVMGVEAPGATLALEALDASVKVGGNTVRLMVLVFVTPPPVAVTVRVQVRAVVPEATASVKVLVPLPGDAMLVGAKLAVTPVGSPLTDKAIADWNPFPAVVVTVTGVEPPCPTLALEALVVSVKLGGNAVTLSI